MAYFNWLTAINIVGKSQGLPDSVIIILLSLTDESSELLLVEYEGFYKHETNLKKKINAVIFHLSFCFHC